MKKQPLNLPNFAVLFSTLALAVFVSGCGATPEETTITTPTTTVPTTTVSSTANTTTQEPTTPTTVVSSATYKDGTYTAVGNYRSPAGAEEIGLTITLKNDIITDTKLIQKATDKISIQMQQMFADNYKPLVIGKKISDVRLSKVSGSSLTSAGFNEALAKIAAQAK